MAFEFKKCDIEGLYEIQPKIFGDNRGYFLETYSEKYYPNQPDLFDELEENVILIIPREKHHQIQI